MQENSFVVIMAGGIGSRFWPLSRRKNPKQFLDLLGTGKSLLQMTYHRFLPAFDPQQIFIVTASEYVGQIQDQLPDLPASHIIAEPMRKNTAPAIAYTAMKLQNLHPNSTMVVTPADHIIFEQKEFLNTIQKGIEFVTSHHSILTIGIQPTKPHTGYGYIQYEEGEEECKEVALFTEKPSIEFAQQFLDSGDFLWNSGIFIWTTNRIIQSFQQHLADVYEPLSEVNFNTDTEEKEIQVAYPLCPNISIDYGILEKEDDIYVLPASFTWSDLGTWESLYEMKIKKDTNTTNTKTTVLKNVSNSIIHSLVEDKLIVLQDVDNLIVVDTGDVLLISNKSSEQKLKDVVTSLSAKDFDEYL